MITVIYYTSNRESKEFEKTIQRCLLKSLNGASLISVSQKSLYPIYGSGDVDKSGCSISAGCDGISKQWGSLGLNLCVGDIGVSDKNILHQLLIGCEAATTPFIATAEADFLYPPTGYFDFKPEDENTIYRYTNLWVLDKTRNHFRKKQFSLGAQICGREYLIKLLKRKLSMTIPRGDITKAGWKGFEGEIPCVTVKTGDGMRSHCGTSREVKPTTSLPYWGDIKALKGVFWGVDAHTIS